MRFAGPTVELFQCAAALIGTGALLVWISLSQHLSDETPSTWFNRLVGRAMPRRPDLAARVARSYAACAGLIGVIVGLAFLVAAIHKAA